MKQPQVQLHLAHGGSLGPLPVALLFPDPGDDVDGDADAHDLDSGHRGQDGDPRDLVVLEPSKQLGAAGVRLHLLGRQLVLQVQPGQDPPVARLAPDLLIAAGVDGVVGGGKVLGPVPPAAIQLWGGHKEDQGHNKNEQQICVPSSGSNYGVSFVLASLCDVKATVRGWIKSHRHFNK